jgi:hypothetical protein
VADTKVPTPNISDHTEETIRSIAQLHAEHHENATALERALDHVTALLSRPWFIGVITVIVIGWVGLNLGAVAFGVRPTSPAPRWIDPVSSGSNRHRAAFRRHPRPDTFARGVDLSSGGTMSWHCSYW